MKCIHVSESFNRSSIIKHGLLPSSVLLPQHLATWQEYNFCTSDNKILYTWESCNKDIKFIKDMIFCKMFIHPRNNLQASEWPDFSKILNKFMGKYTRMIYDVYELTVPDRNSLFVHLQESTLDKYNTCYNMPDEFAHNDKILQMFKEPQTSLRIVGTAEFEYNKNNRYIVRVK